MLIEKAKEIAKRLGISDFKGSRGWFDKWKLRYNIKASESMWRIG